VNDREELTVTVPPETASLLRRLVKAGEYASESAILREALAEWSERREHREEAITNLRKLWDQGIASGPSDDGEAAFQRIRGRLAADLPRRE
jgi:antitoxin ParD1/3/4